MPTTRGMVKTPQGALRVASDQLQAEDHAAAASTAAAALEDITVLSRVAVVRGQALLDPLLRQIMDAERDDPPPDAFREVWKMFTLALRLDPDNAVAKEELEKIEGVFEVLEPVRKHFVLIDRNAS